MNMIYLICALVGGTIVVCQFVMTVIGMGDGVDLPDGDMDIDIGADLSGTAGGADEIESTAEHQSSTWLFGVLSFRTIVAGLAFFGVAGMAGREAGQSPMVTLLLALAAGAAAVYTVHWIMLKMHGMRSDGTTQMKRAVGTMGTVYLRVPGGRQGSGKVHLVIQNRTVECAAVTSQDTLPTGAKILVVDVLDHDTVEVELVPEPAREAHV